MWGEESLFFVTKIARILKNFTSVYFAGFFLAKKKQESKKKRKLFFSKGILKKKA